DAHDELGTHCTREATGEVGNPFVAVPVRAKAQPNRAQCPAQETERAPVIGPKLEGEAELAVVRVELVGGDADAFERRQNGAALLDQDFELGHSLADAARKARTSASRTPGSRSTTSRASSTLCASGACSAPSATTAPCRTSAEA